MKLFLFCLIGYFLFAEPIRHEMHLQDDTLTYYVDLPNTEKSMPLVLVVEGSYCDNTGPQSILRLHEVIGNSFASVSIGMTTLERRGVDGDDIDVAKYHAFNTPTQRLLDHIELVHHLRLHPPESWNGQLFILGGSEGGPIAIKLSKDTEPSACVALVGCGDQTFKEYIWQSLSQAPVWRHFYMMCNGDMPFTRKAYEKHVAQMKSNPVSDQFWYGQTYLYWADALDQCEMDAFLQLKCPVFVVAGTKDLECPSTDRLIAQAKEQNQDVTYLRVDGMGHDVLNPQWEVMPKILEFLTDKTMQ